MTLVAPAPRPVLADRVIPRSISNDVALVAAGVALVTLFSYLQVPLWPVPITGQTLAVLLVGSALGAARGGITMIVYGVLGTVGVPVFSPQADGSLSSGWHIIAGPTGGYIVGFVLSATLVGLLAERTWDRQVLKALATFAAGTLVVFAIGLPWLAVVLHLNLEQTLEGGLYPFLIGGAVKAAIAAGLLPLAWWGAGRISARRRAAAETDAPRD
jgi:biotin transport system substrate-specific component